MGNNDRHTLTISIVAIICTLAGALGGAYLTSTYALKSVQEQNRKDITVLSANNAFNNSQEIKKRAESYLISLSELIELIDADRFYVDEAKTKIKKMNQDAQGLMVYGGIELGSASLNLNMALKEALTSASKEELQDKLTKLTDAAKNWYPVYFTVIQSYDRHTMPEKYKADLQNTLIEALFKGINKSIQPN